LIKKLAYSCGGLATALAASVFTTYALFFYVDVIKLPVYLAGIAMLVYAVWNAVNGPIAGLLSDRTRTPYGRRVPYLAFGLIPFGLAFFLLWTPVFKNIDQYKFLFFYFLVMSCLFDGLNAVIGINWAALFPEMFHGLRERTEVNSYRQFFGLLGIILGIGLPPFFYSRWGWSLMGALFALIVMLALFIALLASRERPEFSREPQPRIFQALKASLVNRSFLTFVLANLFIQYSLITVMAATPFFAKYVLKAAPQAITVIMATGFLIALPLLFFWRWLAGKVGAKRTLQSAVILLALALAPLFFINSLESSILWVLILVGAAAAGYLLIADVMLADIIDEDEVNTGARRAGAYFGLNSFVTRFSIGLEAVSLSAVFLLFGYNPYIYTQPKTLALGLRILIAGLPIAALLIASAILLFYPLSGKKLEAMREKLAAASTLTPKQ
jgi:glycoside/pentoside/hexuronide:cation symporter, GPH family